MTVATAPGEFRQQLAEALARIDEISFEKERVEREELAPARLEAVRRGESLDVTSVPGKIQRRLDKGLLT